MKFRLLVLGLVLSCAVSAQSPPAGYTFINSGYEWLRGKFRALNIPAGCDTATAITTGQYRFGGALYADTCRHILYLHTGGAWRTAFNSAIDSIYRKSGQDSIFWRRGGTEFAIKDSAGGGGGGGDLQSVTTAGPSTNNSVYVDRKDTIGTRFSYDWTSGSFTGWTSGLTTTTATAAAGRVTFNGGGLNLNNNISQTFYAGVADWTKTQTVVVREKSNTSFGFAFRLIGTVGSAPDIFMHIFLSDTTGYLAYTNGGALPTYSTSANSRNNYVFRWADDDTLDVTVERRQRVVVTTVVNRRTGSIMSLPVSSVGPTVGRISWYFYGGEWDFVGTGLLVYNEVYQPKVVFLGDSNQWGSGAESQNTTYPAIAMSGVSGGYIMMNAPFETAAEGLLRFPDVVLADPDMAIWAYGTNDGTTQANIDSLCARTVRFIQLCQLGSIPVSVVSVIPQVSATVIVKNDSLIAIAARFGIPYIDIYTQLVGNTGNAINALYNLDNTHINQKGIVVAASVIYDNINYLFTDTPPLLASPLPLISSPLFDITMDENGAFARTYADSSNSFIKNNLYTPGVLNAQVANINIDGTMNIGGSAQINGSGTDAAPNFSVASGLTTVANFTASSGHFTVNGGQTTVASNWLQFPNGTAFIRTTGNGRMYIKTGISGPGSGTLGLFASTEGSVPSINFKPFVVGVADSVKAVFDRWGGLVTNWNNTADARVQFKGDTDTTMFVADAATDRIAMGTLTPEEKLHVVGRVKITDMPASTDVDSMSTVTAGRLNTIAATNWGRTASTGITNTAGTWTANLSTGVNGGQSAIGGTAANDQLIVRGSTVASGSTTTNPDVTFIAGDGAGSTAFQIRKNTSSLFYGSVWKPIRTVSTTTTAAVTDYTILVDASGGAVTINLPAVATLFNSPTGAVFVIKKIDASVNTVTVDGDGSETIDGATTQVLLAQWNSYTIQSNGTAWFIQ